MKPHSLGGVAGWDRDNIRLDRAFFAPLRCGAVMEGAGGVFASNFAMRSIRTPNNRCVPPHGARKTSTTSSLHSRILRSRANHVRTDPTTPISAWKLNSSNMHFRSSITNLLFLLLKLDTECRWRRRRRVEGQSGRRNQRRPAKRNPCPFRRVRSPVPPACSNDPDGIPTSSRPVACPS